ncbi:solute carrier family 16 member 6b isoform X1 [Nerophis ophidion]|uniref:solute carrier family 16 member 6b isoform X1 n=2 Tax=Nerophis ophidion TaxID=159077 RepID=UPI002ADF6843|nr:solute carrier family 16 member 6b isoform X1 [Nerophis ophidion]
MNHRVVEAMKDFFTGQGCLGPSFYPEVPDGGWGWAVAMAFFVVEICTYGTLKSLGVFLQDLMEEFGESNSRVSWVISICVFIFTFTAPLSAVLSNRFGHRLVVMVGGFLISLGTISSAFANSINEMYVTMGVVSGLGHSLAFLPTLTLLAQYFSRRRALVTSAASSGESFAMFAFAPVLTRLKDHMGWRCCLLLLGILQSAVLACGLLLRPIVIQPPPDKEDGIAEASVSLKELQAAYELENEQTKTSISSQVSAGSEDSGITSLSSSNVELRVVGVEAQLDGAMRDKEDQEASWDTPLQPEAEPELAGPSGPPRPKLVDLSVLKDGAFICYSLFGLLATLGFFAPQLYIIQLSKSRGVDSSTASCMLSVMAVADIFGRLSIGPVLSKARCRKTLVLLWCVMSLCLVLVAFTLVWDFWGLAVCCALYGYFLGTVGSTHIPMLAEEDVVGVEKMASSVGVYVFIQSFAGLAGPPLGGALVDLSNDYGAAFYSCAVGMGLAAVCLALLGPVKSGRCPMRACGPEEDLDSQVESVRCPTRTCGPEEDLDSQDSGQPDFLEVDLAVEDTPVKKNPCVA